MSTKISTKTKIIETLLKFDSLSTPQLSEKCGYSSNDIDNIHSQLLELESEGYFKTKRGTANRGRPPTIYKIKRDFEIILKIYENFPELEPLARQTEWILDEIIEKLIKAEDLEIKNEIKIMLRISPQFFQLFLTQPKILSLINQWNEINNVLLPSENDDEHVMIDVKSRSYLKFSEFFAYCVFSDALNSEISKDSWEYLQNLRQRMRNYHEDVNQHLQSYESMRAIMYALGGVQKILSNEVNIDENKPELHRLMVELNNYTLLQERQNVVNFRDNDLEKDSIRIYEKILQIFSNNYLN